VSCPDCSGLAIRAESLQRRLDSALAGLDLAERENAGLRAVIERLREQNFALAAQVRETP
jgi:hypothetical protein